MIGPFIVRGHSPIRDKYLPGSILDFCALELEDVPVPLDSIRQSGLWTNRRDDELRIPTSSKRYKNFISLLQSDIYCRTNLLPTSVVLVKLPAEHPSSNSSIDLRQVPFPNTRIRQGEQRGPKKNTFTLTTR